MSDEEENTVSIKATSEAAVPATSAADLFANTAAGNDNDQASGAVDTHENDPSTTTATTTATATATASDGVTQAEKAFVHSSMTNASDTTITTGKIETDDSVMIITAPAEGSEINTTTTTTTTTSSTSTATSTALPTSESGTEDTTVTAAAAATTTADSIASTATAAPDTANISTAVTTAVADKASTDNAATTTAATTAATTTTATITTPEPHTTANPFSHSSLSITSLSTDSAHTAIKTTTGLNSLPLTTNNNMPEATISVLTDTDSKEETWEKVLTVETASLERVDNFLSNLRSLFRASSRDVVEVIAQKKELDDLIFKMQQEDNPDVNCLQVMKADAEQLAQQIRLYDDLSRNSTSRASQHQLQQLQLQQQQQRSHFAFAQQPSPNSTSQMSDTSPTSAVEALRSPGTFPAVRRLQSQTSEFMFLPPETPTSGYNYNYSNNNNSVSASVREQDNTTQQQDTKLAALDISQETNDFSPPTSPLFSSGHTPREYSPLQQAYAAASTYVSAFREILYDAQKRKIESKRLCEGFLVVESSLLAELCLHVSLLPPQGQSSVSSIFKYLFENYKEGSTAYMLTRPNLLNLLIDGYSAGFCGHATGSILRQCARQAVLCDLIHKSPSFSNFFNYVQLSTFELASDAFSTFGLCLTRHPPMCAKWLLANFDFILVEKWGRLLLSRTYVTQRQALTILRQILNNRAFFHVMIKYISTKKCLDVIVYLMTARKIKEGIRLDAFHVLKIYVQNPRKTPEIQQVLIEQSSKLLKGMEELTPTKEMEIVQDMLEKLLPKA